VGIVCAHRLFFIPLHSIKRFRITVKRKDLKMIYLMISAVVAIMIAQAVKVNGKINLENK
jgi:hypothetical protein